MTRKKKKAGRGRSWEGSPPIPPARLLLGELTQGPDGLRLWIGLITARRRRDMTGTGATAHGHRRWIITRTRILTRRILHSGIFFIFWKIWECPSIRGTTPILTQPRN